MIGVRIAHLRRDRRAWTQERLAERAEIARSYLACIEAGHRRPSRRVLRDIARALGVEMSELAK